MSKLLEEARLETSMARFSAGNQNKEEPEYMYNQGFHMACKHMLRLIEKHEKPKGLMQCVRPSYREFPPLEFSTNFWKLKYRVLNYVQLGKDVKEARVGIEEEFSKFHFAELNIELTEKQQEIYEDLMSYYEASMVDDPKYALSLALGDYGHNDKLNKNSDLLPALKRFISEVDERS